MQDLKVRELYLVVALVLFSTLLGMEVTRQLLRPEQSQIAVIAPAALGVIALAWRIVRGPLPR
jgi:hypothetical protein